MANFRTQLNGILDPEAACPTCYSTDQMRYAANENDLCCGPWTTTTVFFGYNETFLDAADYFTDQLLTVRSPVGYYADALAGDVLAIDNASFYSSSALACTPTWAPANSEYIYPLFADLAIGVRVIYIDTGLPVLTSGQYFRGRFGSGTSATDFSIKTDSVGNIIEFNTCP